MPPGNGTKLSHALTGARMNNTAHNYQQQRRCIRKHHPSDCTRKRPCLRISSSGFSCHFHFFDLVKSSTEDWESISSRRKFRTLSGLQSRLRLSRTPFQLLNEAYPSSNHAEEIVVIKAVQGHPRVENEREVLKRFQNKTPNLRPLIDEIEEPSSPPTIVLKHIEDHLLNASIKKTLNRTELRYVAKRILEALNVLHEEDYVHTGNYYFPRLWFDSC